MPAPVENEKIPLPDSKARGTRLCGWRAACAVFGTCVVLLGVTLGVLAATVPAVACFFGKLGKGVSGGGSDNSVQLGDSSITVPEWQPGATFNYSVHTWRKGASGSQQKSSRRVRVVNVGKDPATHHYMLGADAVESALEHAVLNGFPFFGRVASFDLGVYEDGAPQPLFGFFPMTSSSKASESIAPWHFRLFQINWQGSVVGVEPTGGADGKSAVIKFQATERGSIRGAAQKRVLKYELDVGVGFLRHLVLSDLASGETQLEMKLDSFRASGFKGNVFFVRATDVFDGTWPVSTPISSVAPSDLKEKQFESGFSIGQHRTDGAWDMLVYVTDVAVDCDATSAASLKLTGKGAQRIVLERSFATCQTESAALGAIKQPLDEAYDVAVSLTGPTTTMRLRIAGGLLFNYTV